MGIIYKTYNNMYYIILRITYSRTLADDQSLGAARRMGLDTLDVRVHPGYIGTKTADKSVTSTCPQSFAELDPDCLSRLLGYSLAPTRASKVAPRPVG